MARARRRSKLACWTPGTDSRFLIKPNVATGAIIPQTVIDRLVHAVVCDLAMSGGIVKHAAIAVAVAARCHRVSELCFLKELIFGG